MVMYQGRFLRHSVYRVEKSADDVETMSGGQLRYNRNILQSRSGPRFGQRDNSLLSLETSRLRRIFSGCLYVGEVLSGQPSQQAELRPDPPGSFG